MTLLTSPYMNVLGGPGEALVNLHKSLLETGDFSDLTLKTPSKEFKLHRCILFMAAPGFAKIEHSGVVMNIEDDSLALEHLIRWAYTRNYAAIPIIPTINCYEKASSIAHDISIAAVAHRYGASDLVQQAWNSFAPKAVDLNLSKRGQVSTGRGQIITQDTDRGRFRCFLTAARTIMANRQDLPEPFYAWVCEYLIRHGEDCSWLSEFQNAMNGFLLPVAYELQFSSSRGNWRRPRVQRPPSPSYPEW